MKAKKIIKNKKKMINKLVITVIKKEIEEEIKITLYKILIYRFKRLN